MRANILIIAIAALVAVGAEPASAQRKTSKKKPRGDSYTGTSEPSQRRKSTSTTSPGTPVAAAPIIELDPAPCPEPSFDEDALRARTILPESALALNVTGTVEVRVLVDEHGVPVSHRIVASDNELLDAAAVAAVMGLRFVVPSAPSGMCSPWVTVPVVFRRSE
jgi:TonB family protein